MENYPRAFIKTGLIYVLVGALLGILMAVEPALSVRVRFVHIHIMLLGFMTMMIAGVAFHVLPRFSARPLPWPGGMRVQFILQNIGLIGMVAVYAAGGGWREGGVHILFIAFAITTAASLAIMFYNLYFVLQEPAKPEVAPTHISGGMKVGEVLDQFPKAMAVFLDSGFAALANPVARATFAKVATVEAACKKHNIDLNEFLEKLNTEVFSKSTTPAAPSSERKEAEGREIHKGEACQADTLVGSLLKVYPGVKPVFEKHYGEGCFSCPGQSFETVEQTAQMHNIATALILTEVNAVIGAELEKG